MSAPASLAPNAIKGDRRALARIITAIESGSAGATALVAELYPHTGSAYAVGITGAPGSGKSTLTDRLISAVRAQELPVAVLAVDPSSPFTGGAILGDRVRMQGHATDENVFIRSMASRGHLGGLSLAAPQAIRAMDACGYPWILVETVGVGQIEVEIASTADTTVVVVNPGWGDSVQTNKAGLLEVGDVFVVNKADRDGAAQTVRDLEDMLHLSAPASWSPPVVTTDALSGSGVDDLWATIQEHRAHQEQEGSLVPRRRQRLAYEIERIVAERVLLQAREIVRQDGFDELVDRVEARSLDPYSAAAELLPVQSPHG